MRINDADFEGFGGFDGFSFKKLGRSLDVTSKKSVVRKGLRGLDKAVGGGQGWGVIVSAAGSVVAVIPGGQAIGAGMITAGGALGKSAKIADDKRKAAREAALKQKVAEAQAGYLDRGGQAKPGAMDAARQDFATAIDNAGQATIPAVPGGRQGTAGTTTPLPMPGAAKKKSVAAPLGGAAAGFVVAGPIGALFGLLAGSAVGNKA